VTVLQIVSIVLGGIVGLVLAYLVVLIFTPLVREPDQPLPDVERLPPTTPPPGVRRDVSFGDKGQRRVGWLYLPPEADGPVACVVLNNGCGATKEMILERYALRFVESGLAALTYDYRHFGESEGEPRQQFSIDRQVNDCHAAIEYVRGLPEIDGERIAVWGTSAAGGYGLLVAADDPGIRCLVSQCPGLDHNADGKMVFAREGLGWMLRIILHAQRDKGRSRFGLSPHHLPIVGRPGSTALLTAPGALEGYTRIATSGFENKVCARVMLTRHGPTPDRVIEKVRCPALFQICDDDALASAEGAVNLARRMGDLARIERYPIGHFDIYEGEAFEKAVTTQIEFLEEHLLEGDASETS
jgi:pimeloyl-ACP methyl ester carboxylesterase